MEEKKRAVWPDLAKCGRFVKIIDASGNFNVSFEFGKKINQFWQFIYANWAIFHCRKWPNIEELRMPSSQTESE